LCNPANTQTNADGNITSLVKVMMDIIVPEQKKLHNIKSREFDYQLLSVYIYMQQLL